MSKLNTRGLTLIECVISILILSVTVTGGLMLYSNANVIMSTAMHKKMALEMAVQEMEKVKSAGWNSPPPQSPRTFGLATAQPFTAQISRTITDVPKKNTDLPTSPMMKKVELEVSWTEGKSGLKTVKLETLMLP